MTLADIFAKFLAQQPSKGKEKKGEKNSLFLFNVLFSAALLLSNFHLLFHLMIC